MKNEKEIVWVDRYSALGMECPLPDIVCKGHCEGTGVIPIYMREGDRRNKTVKTRTGKIVLKESEIGPVYIELWRNAEEKEPTDDGWHFITCPECNGTGRIK